MTDLDPFSVNCPTCHARKGKSCVYIWPKDWDGTPRIRHVWLAPDVLARMDRAGTPTHRPHNERYAKARLKRQVERRRARDAEYASENALGTDRVAALKANAQAVLDEQHQLIAWLREHALILIQERVDSL